VGLPFDVHDLRSDALIQNVVPHDSRSSLGKTLVVLHPADGVRVAGDDHEPQDVALYIAKELIEVFDVVSRHFRFIEWHALQLDLPFHLADDRRGRLLLCGHFGF
jgi:hypothetical protein